MGLGSTELLIIAGAVFLLFGASFIPKFAKGMGEAKRELKKLQDEDKDD
jgi:sec-independent protein translocase protein TatA